MPDIQKLTEAIPEKNHEQQYEGMWDWVGTHLGCCDCGLVHRIEFQVVSAATGKALSREQLAEKGVGIQMRSFRDSELTKKARESQNFTCKIPLKGGEGQ